MARSTARRPAPAGEALLVDDGSQRLAWSLGMGGSALSVLGIGVSAYLTYAHYSAPTVLACPERGTVNCLKVTTSSYAVQHGIPLVVLGLAFFAVSLVVQLPPLWLRA
ncbi:MAG TPA: vitamin K epoxide reductase family protein, partial [Acidimicrobiales bacterium]|nr:vitamin K epoxide reductase family protein [Acidimicrobiales bacterium]